jgi:hypothetical protein
LDGPPLGVEIPRELDLGEASFEVVPRGKDSVAPVDDPRVEWLVEKCVHVGTLARWERVCPIFRAGR